jgi:hypothetical protein
MHAAVSYNLLDPVMAARASREEGGECVAFQTEASSQRTPRWREPNIGPTSGKVVDSKFQRSDSGRSNTDFGRRY